MCSCRLRLEEELASQWLTCLSANMVISLHLFFLVACHWLLSPDWLRLFWAWHFKATQDSSGFTFLLLIPYLITTLDSHCSFNMLWLLPWPCLFNPSFQASDTMFPFPSNFLRSHTSQSNPSISKRVFFLRYSFFGFTCFYLFCMCMYTSVHMCHGVHVVQRTALGNWFSPSTMWVPEITLGASGLVETTPTAEPSQQPVQFAHF